MQKNSDVFSNEFTQEFGRDPEINKKGTKVIRLGAP